MSNNQTRIIIDDLRDRKVPLIMPMVRFEMGKGGTPEKEGRAIRKYYCDVKPIIKGVYDEGMGKEKYNDLLKGFLDLVNWEQVGEYALNHARCNN